MQPLLFQATLSHVSLLPVALRIAFDLPGPRGMFRNASSPDTLGLSSPKAWRTGSSLFNLCHGMAVRMHVKCMLPAKKCQGSRLTLPSPQSTMGKGLGLEFPKVRRPKRYRTTDRGGGRSGQDYDRLLGLGRSPSQPLHDCPESVC